MWHNGYEGINMANNNLVYILDNKIYINLTNMCTNNCKFCIRQQKDDVVGTNMWLETENYHPADVIIQLENYSDKIENGVTFCGYGEPTMKLENLKTVAKYLKEYYPDVNIKVNTNGHGNLINKKDILPELKGLVDEFSISLNAQNEELCNELSQPKVDNAYQAMLDFAKEASDLGFKTTLSVVSKFENYDIDLEYCNKIAHSLNAEFRNREFIPNGY